MACDGSKNRDVRLLDVNNQSQIALRLCTVLVQGRVRCFSGTSTIQTKRGVLFMYFDIRKYLVILVCLIWSLLEHCVKKGEYNNDIVQRYPFHATACAWRFSPNYLTRQRSYLHRGELI